MHVAGAVLQPEDVPGLGHVGEQGVVARVLPMMGVEATEGPPHRGPGPDDRSIDVDRQTRQIQPGQRLGHEVAVEGDERGKRLLRELAQPVGHGAAGGQPGQAAEARHERIAAEVAQVFQAPGPDVEQREQHQGDARTAVVAAEPGERLAQSCPQIDLAQIAPQQLQTAVRRERLGDELDREITLDHPSQARYAQTHQRGLQWVRERIGVLSLKTALEASLIHVPRTFTSAFIRRLGLCAQQGVSLAGESPAAPSQGGCVDKRPGGTRRPRGASREEGRVSIARWNLKGLRRTSGP